jgi:hypothetical protein
VKPRADVYHGRVRPRPGSLAVLAVLAGSAAGLLLTGCGGSGGDPRPAGGASGAVALSASASAPVASGLGGLPAVGTGDTPAQPGPAVPVTVSPEPIGAAMPESFLGLSLEYPTLERYLGTDPRHLDPVFLDLLRGLDPGQRPILRIGGDSTDRTWWPVHGMRVPEAIDFSLNRRWAAVARGLATDSGGRLILGINLADGSRRLAAIEVRHLISGVGSSRIADLEIGNEPDDYNATAWYWRHGQRVFARASTYSVTDYVAQFTSWRRVIPRSIPVAGPALARTQWMSAALRAELSGRRPLSLVTFHRYPLRACETNPRASDYPTIPRLLSDSSSAGLAALVAPYVAQAHRAHRPFRLDELNSVSCQGKLGVSNTFASALWMLNTLFNARAVGVDGVNVQMLPGSAYQPFSVAHTGRRWSGSVSPVYYGMLMFARAFPPGARLLGVSAPPGSLKVWATRGARGRLRIVLINEDPIAPVLARLRLPGAQAALHSQALVAPSVSATGSVTLGGQTFGALTGTGRLPAAQRAAPLAPMRGYYGVAVPAGSAVLLTG